MELAPRPVLPNEAVVDIAAGAQGWALSTALDLGWSPIESLHVSADGRLWQPIPGLAAEDLDSVTGLAVTDDGVVVVASFPPEGHVGFECTDVEPMSYRAYLAAPTS